MQCSPSITPSGGIVLQPEPNSYTTPIEVFDVKSLYPTVMILHNLSFETVCCSCCKDNADARLQQSIMESINTGLQDKIKSKALYESEKRTERYWVCVRNKEAIPRMLVKFKQEREHYRILGDESMSQALKVIMNSIYGLFGSVGIFAFQDYTENDHGVIRRKFSKVSKVQEKGMVNESLTRCQLAIRTKM